MAARTRPSPRQLAVKAEMLHERGKLLANTYEEYYKLLKNRHQDKKKLREAEKAVLAARAKMTGTLEKAVVMTWRMTGFEMNEQLKHVREQTPAGKVFSAFTPAYNALRGIEHPQSYYSSSIPRHYVPPEVKERLGAFVTALAQLKARAHEYEISKAK